MKKSFNFKNRNLFAVIVASLFVLTSCSDKVDSYLDKAENVISKYEDMAAAKKFSDVEENKMLSEIEKIDEDYKLNVGKEPNQWAESQRVRRVKFNARIDKLKEASRLYERERTKSDF